MALAITAGGPVQGVELEGGVLFFGGVPYAEAARFGPPMPPTPWSIVRDATVPGPCPPQTIGALDLTPGSRAETTSEDCLTAEVWTPTLDGSRPIVLWIPGGSFLVGGASLPTYDGARLAADEDLVVIGVNYRLGALGFLNVEGVPSNLGLRDLRRAIEWVKENAASFGGDPERVVLMGESAGAGAIAHLLCDPQLPVQGAMAFSGSPTMTQSPERASQVAGEYLAASGTTLDGLRELSTADLIGIQETAVASVAPWAGMLPFHPWVDDDLITSPPISATLAAVPLVVGTTAHEMELFRSMVPQLPEQHAVGYLSRKPELGPIGTEAARRLVSRHDGDLVPAIADVDLVIPNDHIAAAHAARGNAVWRTTFTWEAPVVRACHALDLPFLFGTLDVDNWRDFAGAHVEAADVLSRRMRAMIGSFARDGVPSCEPVGEWPQWPKRVELGAEIVVEDGHG